MRKAKKADPLQGLSLDQVVSMSLRESASAIRSGDFEESQAWSRFAHAAATFHLSKTQAQGPVVLPQVPGDGL